MYLQKKQEPCPDATTTQFGHGVFFEQHQAEFPSEKADRFPYINDGTETILKALDPNGLCCRLLSATISSIVFARFYSLRVDLFHGQLVEQFQIEFSGAKDRDLFDLEKTFL